MDNQVDVKIVAQTGPFNAGMKAAANEFKGFTDLVTNNVDKLKAAFVALGTAFAVKQIADLEEHFAKLAEEIDRTAQMTGLATIEVQQFTAIVEQSGGSVEGGIATLTKLERSMVEAARGTGDTALAFEALKIKVTDAHGELRPVQEVLSDLAEKFKNTENGATKTAYAMQLMGRGGAQLIPVLNEGKEGLAEFNEELKKTASIMSGEQLAAFKRLDDSIDMLGASWEGFKLQVATLFEPAAEKIVEWLTKIIQLATEGAQKINAFFGGISTETKDSPQEKKDNLPIAQTEKSLAEARKFAETRLAIEKNEALVEIDVRNQANEHLLAIGAQTNQEYLEQELKISQDKMAILNEYYRAKQLAAKDSALEEAKVAEEAAKAGAAAGLEIQKIKDKQTQESLKGYREMFDNISGGFQSMTEKLIRGTATWKEAFRTMCADMIVAYAKMQVANVAKMLWAAAIDKQITISGAIMKRAADAVGAAGGAYRAMAGIPYIGPVLGAVAAAGAFAGVMAFGLPSAEGGWDNVPNDGVAMIHKKEMVLPAPLAERVRNMTDNGVGGANYNITIQAVDSKSFGDMIKRNPNFIVDALQNQSRNFNVNAPGWRAA